MSEHWVLRKNGYFYRPGRAGYTPNISEAGRFSEEDANRHAQGKPGVYAHPLSRFEDKVPVKFIPPTITADAVKEYRAKTGASVMYAKHFLRRQLYEDCMGRFRASASTEDKVEFILDWITDKEMGR